MDLKLALRDHILVAEVSGQLTLREALRIGVLVCDGAAERGVSSILMDPSGVDGELSDFDRYEVGKTLADYCMAHGWCYRVALLGNEPVVTGFGALVASNRGLVTERFSDRKKALEWLNSFAVERADPSATDPAQK